MTLVTKNVDCNVSTTYYWSSSGDGVDWLCISSDWCISILIVHCCSCFLRGLLCYCSPMVVFLGCVTKIAKQMINKEIKHVLCFSTLLKCSYKFPSASITQQLKCFISFIK